jgi:hypothetical protein
LLACRTVTLKLVVPSRSVSVRVGLALRVPLEHLGGHEAVRRLDLEVGAAPAELGAVGVAGHVAPRAARPEVNVAHHQRRGLPAPPAADELRGRPGLEDEGRRRVEDPGDEDLPI